MPEPITQPAPLVCAGCHRADPYGDGRGWRADWASGHDDQEPELVVLCPECWEREFGVMGA